LLDKQHPMTVPHLQLQTRSTTRWGSWIILSKSFVAMWSAWNLWLLDLQLHS